MCNPSIYTGQLHNNKKCPRLGWVKMQQMTESGRDRVRETWDGRRNHWKRRVRQLGTTFLPQNNAIQFIKQIIIYDIKKLTLV